MLEREKDAWQFRQSVDAAAAAAAAAVDDRTFLDGAPEGPSREPSLGPAPEEAGPSATAPPRASPRSAAKGAAVSKEEEDEEEDGECLVIVPDSLLPVQRPDKERESLKGVPDQQHEVVDMAMMDQELPPLLQQLQSRVNSYEAIERR